MTRQEKNAFSHRARAFENFMCACLGNPQDSETKISGKRDVTPRMTP